MPTCDICGTEKKLKPLKLPGSGVTINVCRGCRQGVIASRPQVPTKQHHHHIVVDDGMNKYIDDLCHALGLTRSEVWRRMAVTVRTLYSDNLKFVDAIRDDADMAPIHKALEGSNKSLVEALKPMSGLIQSLLSKKS